MTGPTLDSDTLGRFLAGETSHEEAAVVRRWLDENPSDAHLVEVLEREASRSTPQVDVEAALRTVKARLRATEKTPSRLWTRYVPLAAAAVAVAAAGLMLARRAPVVREQVATQSYSTNVGERRVIWLVDGTTVLLGPATQLVVRGRDADLGIGEALFTVTHDALRPFTVRAGDAVIQDIGTEFTVHNDPGASVRVVVGEGAVQLTHGRESVTLTKGDVGMLEAGGHVDASRGAATEDDLAWTHGRLVFRNASVPELAADLRRWYGVEFRVSDTALAARHFTGSFTNETPDRVLDVIALALGASVDRRGDTAYIRTPARR
ncbi:MAG TPA: FecR domain-containing protein [Gemmatimonadaceae bacterium]|nr:FecR domain-containing protein [Gemmatimonadaceae bacterium]